MKNKKVILGLSGGVDSALTALLLKERGFQVIGVFLKLFEDNDISKKRAKGIAKEIGISFKEIDKSKEFKKSVIDYFTKSYSKGITPNPCTVCNKEVKFNYLFKAKEELDGSYVATGHYAKIKEKNIYRGADERKDQTYFLWKLEKEKLPYIIFPLGEFKKRQVKEMIKEKDIKTLDFPESQEICFTKKSLTDFLREEISLTPGKIKDKEGYILKSHEGVESYTIGQRKGLDLPDGPYYVLRKEGSDIVVTKEKKDLEKREVKFLNANFFEKDLPVEMEAKIRYNAPLETGKMIDEGLFEFKSSQMAVTPGQSIVFYKNNKLLGGGEIKL